MTDYLQVIVLGIVQGVAEFLPVSSSGHLVIVQALWGRVAGSEPPSHSSALELDVALHAGTLLSILVVYFYDLPGVLRQPRLCAAIVVATIPAAFVGLTLKDWFEQAFQSPLIAGASLLVTAVLLLLGQRCERGSRQLESLPVVAATVVGLFQALALVPGISRSGSTIAGGLFSGLSREEATKFSFLIAIPALGGAAAITFAKMLERGSSGHPLGLLILGGLVAFAVGVVALRILIRMVTQRRLHWFAWYCAAVSILTLGWQAGELIWGGA